MELRLTPEQLAHLAQIGSPDGKNPEQVAQDIIDRALADDTRFREAVRVGIEQADRGEFIEEEEMDARVARLLSR